MMAASDPDRVPHLPVGFMNADHLLEARLLADLEAALAAHERREGTLEAVLEKLSVLAVSQREHFLREESLMRESRFPAYAVHKAEHDRVLAQMDAEARAFRARGDGARLSKYIFETLPRWVEHHVATMDTATARYAAEVGSG